MAPLGGRFTAPTLAHRDAAGGAIHTINGGQWLTPDRQTAVPATFTASLEPLAFDCLVMNRFNALGTAKIIRVARRQRGKGQSRPKPELRKKAHAIPE
jgi:hypothetical protein